jgi:hypothetical protein
VGQAGLGLHSRSDYADDLSLAQRM